MTALKPTRPARSGARARREAFPELENFRLTLAALIGIAFAALVIAGAVLIHDRNHATVNVPQAKWSSFKPQGSGDAAAVEIADYVSLFYRISVDKQLTVITPVGTTQLDQSTGAYTGSGLTVAESSTGRVSDLQQLPGQTVAYDLCGAATTDCSLTLKPTPQLELLAKRQALELALYTFKYLPHARFVTVILPRGLASGTHAGSVAEAVLFGRRELSSYLQTPLNQTLTNVPPSISQLSTWAKTNEGLNVEVLTRDALYTTRVAAEPGGSTLLELLPLPAP